MESKEKNRYITVYFFDESFSLKMLWKLTKLPNRQIVTGRFRVFTVVESFGNRSETVHLDQEMNFKKKSDRKKLFFSGQKIFSRKKLDFFRCFFSIFKNSNFY